MYVCVYIYIYIYVLALWLDLGRAALVSLVAGTPSCSVSSVTTSWRAPQLRPRLSDSSSFLTCPHKVTSAAPLVIPWLLLPALLHGRFLLRVPTFHSESKGLGGLRTKLFTSSRSSKGRAASKAAHCFERQCSYFGAWCDS